MAHKLLTFIAIFSLSTGASAAEGTTFTYSGKDASQVIGQALMKEGAGDELRVQINGVREDDQLAATSSPISASAEDVQLDKAHNRWDATLLLTAAGKNLAPVRLSGKYDEMARVPVLKQRMQNGDIIQEEDIVWDDQPLTHLRKSTVTDLKALVGKSPKRVISAGRAIREDEITGPTIVNKGSQVTLLFKTPTIEIRTLGEAMESGSKGNVIRVKNVASKSIIQGTVEAEGRVRISSPETQSAGM